MSSSQAYSWHEILSDYVRPSLLWLASKGKLNMSTLVANYSTAQSGIACLTESTQGCPGSNSSSGSSSTGRRRRRLLRS